MFYVFKYHIKKTSLFLFFILIGCQIQDPTKHHGIIFLENRSNKLALNTSKKNDVIKILGQPHTKSITNDEIWIYLERTLNKGKYHKLGKHVLEENNVLVLNFDKYGVLNKKKFYNKEDINKIKFVDKATKNTLTQRSFVEKFLSSVKQKMYSNRK